MPEHEVALPARNLRTDANACEEVKTPARSCDPVGEGPLAAAGNSIHNELNSEVPLAPRGGEPSAHPGDAAFVQVPRGFDAGEASKYADEHGHGFTLPGEYQAWMEDIAGILGRAIAELPEHPRILDVGAGEGKFTRLIRDLVRASGREPVVYGVDASPYMLEQARASDSVGITYLVADARALPPAAEKYDLITSCQVMDSFENPAAMLRDWQSSLNPGAHLLTVLAISDPAGWTNRTEAEIARMPLATATGTRVLAEATRDAGYHDVEAGFLPQVSPLYGGAAEGEQGPIGSRYCVLGRAPGRHQPVVSR